MEYPYVENGLVWFNENMIVVDDKVETRWGGNKQYYLDLGYECVNWHEPFYVDVQDLSKSSHIRINVICPICKTSREVTFKNLIRAGHSKCKGCTQIVNRVGRIFTRYTVLKMAGQDKNGQVIWLCKCECGTIKKVMGYDLQSGDTTSCGCRQKEIMREMCGDKHPMWGLTGDKNPNYNPNLTDKERANRRSQDDNNWAWRVKNKDNFTCQCCGKRGVYLESHHLNGYKDFPDQRLVVSNGVTLCEGCHTGRNGFHSWMGGTSVVSTRGNFADFCEEFYPNAPFLMS